MAVRQAPLHGDRAVGGQVVDEESLPHGGHASEGHFCTKKKSDDGHSCNYSKKYSNQFRARTVSCCMSNNSSLKSDHFTHF